MKMEEEKHFENIFHDETINGVKVFPEEKFVVFCFSENVFLNFLIYLIDAYRWQSPWK